MTNMEQLLSVSKMYYEQGLTQQEIAEKAFLSRSHVSRMLKEARALGIVEIIIRSPFENHISLEAGLAERFGMEKVLVAYTESSGPREEFNSVCSMGASYLNSILTNRSVLAVSKGKTVATTVGALKPTKTLPDMRFVQLAGSMESINPDIDEMFILQRVAALYEKERRSLIDCALQMKECRLITLCGGNVCMRLDNGNIAVTPSGMDYEIMTSDDVVIVTPQGKIVEGTRRPTSDLDAILYIFEKFPWVNATIHTHQPYATALGLVQDVFPATLVSQIDALRGDVPVAPFTPSSDKGMGVLTVEHYNGSLAVILRGHGVMAFGPTLQIALYAAVYLEEASQTYLAALATGRKVEPLDPEMVKAELGEPDSWANYLQK